jgi:hypothetical protein
MGLITTVDFLFCQEEASKDKPKKKEEISPPSPPSPPFNKERSKRACLLARLEFCRFGFEEELKFLGHESRRN